MGPEASSAGVGQRAQCPACDQDVHEVFSAIGQQSGLMPAACPPAARQQEYSPGQPDSGQVSGVQAPAGQSAPDHGLAGEAAQDPVSPVKRGVRNCRRIVFITGQSRDHLTRPRSRAGSAAFQRGTDHGVGGGTRDPRTNGRQP